MIKGATRLAVVESTDYAFCMPCASLAERFSSEPIPKEVQPDNAKTAHPNNNVFIDLKD